MQKAQQELQAWLEEHGGNMPPPHELKEKEQRKLRRLRARAGWNPHALCLLQGRQAMAEKDYETALQCFLQAEQLKPEQSSSLLPLGQCHLAMAAYEKAETAFSRALEHDPHLSGAHLGLAQCYLAQRRNLEAAGQLLNVVGLQYFNPPAHYLLGVALHRVGRIPAAVEALSVCLAQNPNYHPAHRRLTHIYRKRLQNEERAAYHERMAGEAKQRHTELRKGITESSGRTVGRTPVLAARDHAATTTPAFTGTLADTIVVVSGLPRSGTSMMMRMLDQGGLPLLTDAVRTADDGNRHGYFEYEPVKGLAKDSAWIDEARGKAVKIVSPLLLHLPRADDRSYRIILMERDVREIADSQRKLIALLGGKGSPRSAATMQAALIHRAEATHRLLDLWAVPTLTISYRQCLADPVGTAAAVNRFLGGSLDETAMSAAVDVTQYRSTAN
jgi:tetratricopeptide (TPR) repeat protein